jgi:hypothetical protein
MAFSSTSNPLPSEYFGSGYVFDEASGTDTLSGLVSGVNYICIPIDGAVDTFKVNTLTELEAAADAAGNGSKVLYGIIKAAYDQLQLATEANRPDSLAITEGRINGATATTYKQQITIDLLFDLGDADLSDEVEE